MQFTDNTIGKNGEAAKPLLKIGPAIIKKQTKQES
jgi:hypothetical protein